MTVKIYTAEHCSPCREVEKLLKQQGNKIDGEDVELIDVESDEGFKKFSDDEVTQGNLFVPSAYKERGICAIKVIEDVLHLECPKGQPPTESD